MTWVRFDDMFPIHRKIGPLDDATFRLFAEAVFWCSRNMTDGRIAADELPAVSARVTKRRVNNLVQRGSWHEAGHHCQSPNCPTPGPDGWVIHDYLEYQFTKERIKADLAAKAERTRRWREKMTGRKGDGPSDAPSDAPGDASRDALVTLPPSPPRPAPKEAGSGTPKLPPAAESGGAPAGGETNHRRSPPCPTCGNALTSAYHRQVCAATPPQPAETQGAPHDRPA